MKVVKHPLPTLKPPGIKFLLVKRTSIEELPCRHAFIFFKTKDDLHMIMWMEVDKHSHGTDISRRCSRAKHQKKRARCSQGQTCRLTPRFSIAEIPLKHQEPASHPWLHPVLRPSAHGDPAEASLSSLLSTNIHTGSNTAPWQNQNWRCLLPKAECCGREPGSLPHLEIAKQGDVHLTSVHFEWIKYYKGFLVSGKGMPSSAALLRQILSWIVGTWELDSFLANVLAIPSIQIGKSLVATLLDLLLMWWAKAV
ncbi:hypothetical protein GUJ93_ZPchr0004g38459 [Zizania palustris]|uniref:Uncharacterized protein n=1 Tax=Zizania palustris TaxID=103762 RepID=A0A8J5S245_ZIZPA|nr:hypothetical protein GUJ93_ZPchr0004g38459 [Zizania palustris]